MLHHQVATPAMLALGKYVRLLRLAMLRTNRVVIVSRAIPFFVPECLADVLGWSVWVRACSSITLKTLREATCCGVDMLHLLTHSES